MITIKGDRQVGKTHLLIGFAASEAIAGKSVLFECYDWKYATEVWRRFLNCCESVDQVRRSNGNLSVTTTTGGSVRFLSGKARAARGFHADVHIFDQVVPGDRSVPGARVYYAPIATEADE